MEKSTINVVCYHGSVPAQIKVDMGREYRLKKLIRKAVRRMELKSDNITGAVYNNELHTLTSILKFSSDATLYFILKGNRSDYYYD